MAKGLALVSGASSGIGFELAELFAGDGYDLVVAADEDSIESCADKLRGAGVDVRAVQVDLRKPEDVDPGSAKLVGAGFDAVGGQRARRRRTVPPVRIRSRSTRRSPTRDLLPWSRCTRLRRRRTRTASAARWLGGTLGAHGRAQGECRLAQPQIGRLAKWFDRSRTWQSQPRLCIATTGDMSPPILWCVIRSTFLTTGYSDLGWHRRRHWRVRPTTRFAAPRRCA